MFSTLLLDRLRRELAGLTHRVRSRRRLAELDAAQLEDIGYSPEQARAEASKPFWKK